jgi:Ca-activated chloride channel family protein
MIFQRHKVSMLVAVFLFCAGLHTNAQEPSAAPGQTIHVNVERVNVGVIVTDSRGKFVRGLQRNEFHIYDNNAEQPITDFATAEEPGQVLLLVEAGPAVYFLQDAHIFAADALLRGLSPSDRVAIARYDAVPTAILALTSDKAAAQNALSAIRFNLGFGQLNLSSSLNTVLDWLAVVPGKKTIVLLSTGVDTSSPVSIQSVQARLQTGDVRILCVSVTGPMRNGKKGSVRQLQQTEEAFQEADARLRALAEVTGGRAYFPENAKAIQGIYGQVAQLVRNEYSLAFAPPAADGAVHSLEVKVSLPDRTDKSNSPGYRIDHRKAYLAPKSAKD